MNGAAPLDTRVASIIPRQRHGPGCELAAGLGYRTTMRYDKAITKQMIAAYHSVSDIEIC